VTIEPEFSLDQPRQINHLTPDGVWRRTAILRRRMDACVLLVKSVGGGRDGTELLTP
jgi:hypothetical protein